ncbi:MULTISPECIES: DUF3325 domain-containing protein [unclassified Pseudoxanthomonas]
MNPSLILVIALALCYAGWCLLCLGMERHHRDFFGDAPSPARRRKLRVGGWFALMLAFAISVYAIGWEFGPVLWGCALMLAALVWALLLPFAARWAVRLAWLAPVAVFAAVALVGAT